MMPNHAKSPKATGYIRSGSSTRTAVSSTHTPSIHSAAPPAKSPGENRNSLLFPTHISSVPAKQYGNATEKAQRRDGKRRCKCDLICIPYFLTISISFRTLNLRYYTTRGKSSQGIL